MCRQQNSYFSLDATETRSDNDDWKTELLETMKVFPDFITPEEEDSIFKEVEPYMKRLRYEFSHWDDVSITTITDGRQSEIPCRARSVRETVINALFDDVDIGLSEGTILSRSELQFRFVVFENSVHFA